MLIGDMTGLTGAFNVCEGSDHNTATRYTREERFEAGGEAGVKLGISALPFVGEFAPRSVRVVPKKPFVESPKGGFEAPAGQGFPEGNGGPTVIESPPLLGDVQIGGPKATCKAPASGIPRAKVVGVPESSDVVTLWKAPGKTNTGAAGEVKTGFDPAKYPGNGPYLATDKAIAKEWRTRQES